MGQEEFYDYLGEARQRELTDKEAYRVHRTLALFPPSVSRALDVASGDGRIAKHLLNVDLAVQTDIALTSLAVATGNRVQADVARMPFPDRSFDIALLCEGLEHFPEDVYEAARREVPRVADRYILASVPFREDVLANTTRCGSCGEVFHKWGHLRRFTKQKLTALFPGFVLSSFETFGKSQPFRLQWVQRINQRFGGVYSEPSVVSICWKCGERKYSPPKRNLVSMPMQAINRLTMRVPTGYRHWAVGLYERR